MTFHDFTAFKRETIDGYTLHGGPVSIFGKQGYLTSLRKHELQMQKSITIWDAFIMEPSYRTKEKVLQENVFWGKNDWR